LLSHRIGIASSTFSLTDALQVKKELAFVSLLSVAADRAEAMKHDHQPTKGHR
jgi:hypothetical protein